jgi:hypothetical protein
MLTKTAIALAAAAIFGAASVAQANEPRDEHGGSKYGPFGQRLGGTGFGPGWRHHRGAHFGFAYVPGHHRVWRHVDHRRGSD